MATIRDIARKANVSVSTVSLALNGDVRVRTETREKVFDAARQLDYRPSRSARSLSSGLAYSIHLLDPMGGQALTSGFLTRFARGLHDSAMEHSYTVALSIVADEREAAEHIETLISERWTDGVVLLNPSENSALLDLMAERDFPYVVLGRDPEGRGLSVDNDNERVGFDAARHLIARGKSTLAFVNGTSAQTFARDRAAGFLAAVDGSGADGSGAGTGSAGSTTRTVTGTVLYNDGSPAAAARLALQAYRRGADGLVVASDLQGVSALRALLDAGARIPRDIAVIGMNNDAIGEYVSPGLSSVDLGAYLLGREAAALLLERVSDPELRSGRRLVPHSVVTRGTT